MALYDTIGRGYTTTRQPDPRIFAHIDAALGDARTVLNVGAGAGSYEPVDRRVVAVEPSSVMIAQRGLGAAPVVRAFAEALPFRTDSFDAAMASLSDHHWPDRAGGFRELQRVARRVVVFQWLPDTGSEFWLTRDYLPGFAKLLEAGGAGHGNGAVFHVAAFTELLPGARVEVVPIPWDCVDGFYGAYWRRPEAYLDPVVRNGISVFARLQPAEVAEGIGRLEADLTSGAWEARNRDVLALDALDLGYRIIVSG